MSKTSLEELDRTNLYEAIRWAMWTLKTHYPDAVCFVATPIQRADREPIPELTEAIIKMANRYNFIVIPAESESGIIRDNEVWEAEGHDLIDGLHPNENGQKKLAKLYCSYILKHYI
jgi:lysophospholipase L1-like esterase